MDIVSRADTSNIALGYTTVIHNSHSVSASAELFYCGFVRLKYVFGQESDKKRFQHPGSVAHILQRSLKLQYPSENTNFIFGEDTYYIMNTTLSVQGK